MKFRLLNLFVVRKLASTNFTEILENADQIKSGFIVL